MNKSSIKRASFLLFVIIAIFASGIYFSNIFFLGTDDLEFEFDDSTKTYSVSGYKGNSEKVVIPSYYKKAPVTGIKDYAFVKIIPNYMEITDNNAVKITSLRIPETITNIGKNAFYNCTSLKKIDVDFYNKNFKSVDGVLFDKKLTSIICYPQGKEGEKYIIPKSVRSINNQAFYNCALLTNIIIPDGVTSIGSSAFYRCTLLESIKIPDSVVSIGESALF